MSMISRCESSRCDAFSRTTELEFQDISSFSPVYDQAAPNETIELGKVRITLDEPNATGLYNPEASLSLRFQPDPRLILEVQASGIEFLNHQSLTPPSIVRVQFDQFGGEADFFVGDLRKSSVDFWSRSSQIQIVSSSSSINKAVFHLFNWPDFWGEVRRVGSETTFRAIELEAGPWKVSIYGPERTTALVKTLERTGGYVLTHIGSITRVDKATFSKADLDDLLQKLYLFFTFALGKSTSPCLALGFDNDGSIVFHQVGLGAVQSGGWKGSHSWLYQGGFHVMADVVNGFWSLCEQEVWKKALAEVISRYSQANIAGYGDLWQSSALLHSQAALELLAWTYLVCDRKSMSMSISEFKKPPMSKNFCSLVTKMKIPVEIPPCLESLRQLMSTKKDWDNPMKLIADIRNQVAHAEKGSEFTDAEYFDAWRLSMWYLDLILLRLCGYNGRYSNRLSYEHELVPWAVDQPSAVDHL